MAKRVPIYCIDSCHLIDWVQKTEGREKEAAAMAEMLAEMEAGKCKVVTSSAVVAEVLPHKCRDRDRYHAFLWLLRGGSNFSVLPLDVPIARMVAELRGTFDFFSATRRTVDAMHLATAIHSGASILYTRDEGLIKLNDGVAKWMQEHSLPELVIKKLE